MLKRRRLKKAEVAYTKDYGKAIELYEGLLKTHGESAEIYYNLGNAYYKENKIAPAILNYEQALLLDPGDGDIRFNLQLARQKSVDKIEPVGDFFLHRWFDKVQNMGLPIRGRKSVLFVYPFYRLSDPVLLLQVDSFEEDRVYLGLVFLVLVIFANIFAGNQKDELINRKKARSCLLRQ